MSSKTKSIKVVNFKALSELEVDFKGCSALITAGNNKGKTTLLRGIVDRIRGEKPELIVKQGETEGKGEMTLTTGEKFVWEFDKDGKDKLTFFTKEGYKSSVTKEIAKRFFPPLFDIDEFLQAQPKQQSKMLQDIVGLDFTEIDARYKTHYDERTALGKAYDTAKAKIIGVPVPEKVEVVDVSEKVKQIAAIQEKNKPLKEQYDADVKAEQKRVDAFNDEQDKKQMAIDAFAKRLPEIEKDVKGWEEEMERIKAKILSAKKEVLAGKELPEPEAKIAPRGIAEPAYESHEALSKEIENATEINAKAQKYSEYQGHLAEISRTEKEWEVKDAVVKQIEIERNEMMANSKLPAGIEITADGILVDGLALDKNQISSSKLYCAALRLASLGLGEVRTLHFDASTLDKNSLAEIEKWASENDLQLLIERPDFDSGDIQYTLLEN